MGYYDIILVCYIVVVFTLLHGHILVNLSSPVALSLLFIA